jgi:hypothetical protein
MKNLNFNQMEVINGGTCTIDSPGNSCFGHCGALFMAAFNAGDNFPLDPVACL